MKVERELTAVQVQEVNIEGGGAQWIHTHIYTCNQILKNSEHNVIYTNTNL